MKDIKWQIPLTACKHWPDAIKSSHWLLPLCLRVCRVWRIAESSQAARVNGALCQHSGPSFIRHCYNQRHTPTCVQVCTHTQAVRWMQSALQKRRNPNVFQDGECLQQTNSPAVAGRRGLLSPVCFLWGSSVNSGWETIFLEKDWLVLSVCWCQNVASVPVISLQPVSHRVTAKCNLSAHMNTSLKTVRKQARCC